MRSYKEFIDLIESSTGERHRIVRHGPKAERQLRGNQRRNNFDRVALKKGGFSRRSNKDYYGTDSEVSSSKHHATEIESFKNQSDFARDTVKAKTIRKRDGGGGAVVRPTADRVLQLRRLRRQMGGDRTPRAVHDVQIKPKDDGYVKNDPRDQMSRGRSFKKETSEVPGALKKVGARSGDHVTAKPEGVMTGEDRKKGGEKRAQIYKKTLGGKMDRRTGLMTGRAKE
jgi:hypothetical protein